MNPCVPRRRQGVYYVATRCMVSPSQRKILPNFAPQIRAALSNMVANTGCTSPGELEITWSTSDVAVCCSNASFSSRVSRATSVTGLAAEELRRGAAFSALRGFSFAVLRRRVLTGLPPALERLFTASHRLGRLAS